MKEQRIPMISGDEYDALTQWKNVCFWQAGQRKRIKRRYRKRVRRLERENHNRLSMRLNAVGSTAIGALKRRRDGRKEDHRSHRKDR